MNKDNKNKMVKSKTPAKVTVPALYNGLMLLEMVLSSDRDLGFNEIVTLAELPRASTSRLLKVLKDQGYVAKDRVSGKYTSGPNTIGLKSKASIIDILRQKSGPVLESLVEKTRNTAVLVYWTGRHMLGLNKVMHQQSVPMQPIGNIETDFSTGPAGWIFYQQMTEPQQKQAHEQMKDKKYFLKRLPELWAHYEKHGFCYDDLEFVDYIKRLAAPVFNHSGDLIGAIALGGNTLTIPDDHVGEMGRLLAEHAEMLSDEM